MTKINAVILAGGQGTRMNGEDKGLINLNGVPLYQQIMQRLAPQVTKVSINANRNLDIYRESGLEVFPDELEGFQGALSGMLTALKRAKANNDCDFVLFVPCDNPHLPLNLAEKLLAGIVNIQQRRRVLASYAHNGERPVPTCCLLSPILSHALEFFLASGERKMLNFLLDHAVEVDFSAEAECFTNINAPKDLLLLNK